MSQLSFDFSAKKPDITTKYKEFHEVIRAAINSCPMQEKHIAGDLDMSPQTFSKKLNPHNDKTNFSVYDLPRLIRVLNDEQPEEKRKDPHAGGNIIILWLIYEFLKTVEPTMDELMKNFLEGEEERARQQEEARRDREQIMAMFEKMQGKEAAQ